MNRGIVRVSPQLLVGLLEALSEGDDPRAFRVTKHGLPASTRYVQAFYDERRDWIEILVESPYALQVDQFRSLRHSSGFPYLLATEITVVLEKADLLNV